MTRKLLDTTFLIHYWAGRSDAESYLERRENDSTFCTTTLNVKEIAVGRELQGELDPAKLRTTFDWLTVVPFTFDHAVEAGRLEAALRRTNENQDRINALTGDLLIAAVARELDAAVVTENTDDFQAFDGVEVETY